MLGGVKSGYAFLEKYKVIVQSKNQYNKQHIWGMIIWIIIFQAVSRNTMHGYTWVGNLLGFHLEVVDLKQVFCLSSVKLIRCKAKSVLYRLSSTLTKESRLSRSVGESKKTF